MLRLLSLLIFGDWHRHEWEEQTRVRKYEDGQTGPDDKPVKLYIVMKCKVCGKLKNHGIS